MNRLMSSSERRTAVAVGCSAFLGCASMYAPHTLVLKYVRRTFSACENGVEVPVKNEVKDLAQEVLDKICLFDTYEASIDFFTVNGQDLFNKGSCQQITGAIIGIPPTFGFKTLEEVRDSKLVVNGQRIDDNSSAAQSLSKSLLLSEKAKKFGIAREIMHTNDNHPYVKGLMFGGAILGAYYSGRYISIMMQLKQRYGMAGRIALYASVSFGFLTLYGILNDAYECRRDRRSDMWAAQLGKDYALGGIEFYNKALERNMAIRTLMGPDGEKCYTRGGNVVTKTLETVVPLTSRRENLIEYFSEYVKKEESKKKTATAETKATKAQA